MLWKCCTQYASKFGKLSSCHRTGKGQFSFQSQRKAMPKNAQTTAQLHSSHTLVTSLQFSSVAQLCPTFHDPMNHSMPGLPVHHQLPEFTETHVHWVSDAIQPSHPHSLLLLPPIPPSIRVFSNESTLHMPTSAGSWKKQVSSRKTSISAWLTMPKPFTVWITTNCGKFFKRWEYQTT